MENRQLAEEIKMQRSEIDALLTGLESVVGDLENANQALLGKEMDGVVEVIRSQK